MLADRAYDSDNLRQWLGERGTTAVIPNKCNRKKRSAFNERAYRLRHRIENAFCRLQGLSPHRNPI
jgi:putative transposase